MRLVIAAFGIAATMFAQAPGAPPTAPAKRERIVPPARITSFTAQPESIKAGDAVTLTWATENPNSATISPEPGRVTPRGSRQVKPAATTTYTLTVTGPNNTTLTKTVTVNVAGTTAISAAPAKPAERKVARMPDGKPDLSGVYNFGGGGRGGGAPAADAPALKPGAEKYKVVRGPTDSGLYSDCMPTGIPGAYSVPYQWQIVQGLDKVVILYEYPHLFRVIPTHGGPHQADLDPTWMGDSIGHWEGDTLVVDVTGFNEKTELPGGFKHTEGLHVVERFTKSDPDTIQYEATVEDPNVFVKPWKVSRTFTARPDLERVDEFVCENNRDYSLFFKK